MNHYKSWAGLKRQLTDLLCDELKDRLSYFLTRYHKVHNSYGRAAICLDKRELVCFSWIEMYHQEADLNQVWEETGVWDCHDLNLKKKWDEYAAYCDMDFLSAASLFLQTPIMKALHSDNYIVQIFAIVDRRIGKRTLRKLKEDGAYQSCPAWVKQFYDLRLEAQPRRDACQPAAGVIQYPTGGISGAAARGGPESPIF